MRWFLVAMTTVTLVGAGLGCGGEATPEPTGPHKISPTSVPSLSLLSEGGRPQELSASGTGMSCEEVISEQRERAREQGVGDEAEESHNDEIKVALSEGHFLVSCEVPETTAVELCVAVIDGRAKGVTVTMVPGNIPMSDCVADQIRDIEFPEHDLVSVARTKFEPG